MPEKFKVLLVYPNLMMVNLLPTNLAVLAACLKQNNFDVKLFDTTLYRTAEKSVDEIRVEHMQLREYNLKEKGVTYKETDVFQDFTSMVDNYDPDIIGVSATDDTYDLGIGLIKQIRKSHEVPIIFGGVYPTFSPEEVINNENIDMICIGEGENVLVELCSNLRDKKDITRISNLWVKQDGKIFKNPMRKPIDLDRLPYEDFSIFEEQRFFRPMQGKVYRMVPIALDRGCPYECSFCAAPILRGMYRKQNIGPYFRTKPTSRVINEISYHVQKYRADYIYFNTETLFARSEKEMEELAQEYQKIGLPFWCQTRVETITESRVKMLEDMNCDRMSVGIEHGNEEFRKKMLKKRFTNQQVIKAFSILGKSRIPVTVNNIIGFPDETRELVFDTVRLNRQIRDAVDSINAYFFMPYTGTPLRQYCLDKGYLRPNAKTDSLMRSSILEMPQFPPEEIKGLVRTFPLYVKMPEEYYPRIRVAEKLDDEGDSALAELREVYFKEYFK